MTNISSKIDRAKELAAQHAAHAKAAEAEIKKRDDCLYRLLDVVHDIDRELGLMGKKKLRQLLQAKYGMSLPKNLNDFWKKIYPALPPKRRWKYVRLLRHVSARKKADTSLTKFVHQQGGINLRKAKKHPTMANA